MKKIALLMALLMLVLSLAACGGEKNEPKNTTGSDATSETGETLDVTDSTCEHQYTQEPVSEATCTQKGIMQYTCTVCEASYTEEIPAFGHDGSSASCTEASTCANCGEVVEDAWGHKDENGICANCGISMTDVEVPINTEAAQGTEATEATQAAE